jgi:hypothetical protein
MDSRCHSSKSRNPEFIPVATCCASAQHGELPCLVIIYNRQFLTKIIILSLQPTDKAPAAQHKPIGQIRKIDAVTPRTIRPYRKRPMAFTTSLYNSCLPAEANRRRRGDIGLEQFTFASGSMRWLGFYCIEKHNIFRN